MKIWCNEIKEHEDLELYLWYLVKNKIFLIWEFMAFHRCVRFFFFLLYLPKWETFRKYECSPNYLYFLRSQEMWWIEFLWNGNPFDRAWSNHQSYSLYISVFSLGNLLWHQWELFTCVIVDTPETLQNKSCPFRK